MRSESGYSDEEMYGLHVVHECPWDCPFCFGNDDYPEDDYIEPQEWDDEY